ncbi:hypothetical protein [Candidatus Palauibacter sp.]|uniref:hypothetical protein n=1 Tax=Candidatus Palauibacter sp. TaxID=3101350 RepID=UPI003B020E80
MYRTKELVIGLLALTSVTASCTRLGFTYSEDARNENEDARTAMQRAINEIGTGLMVVSHPYSCSLTSNQIRHLNDLHENRLKVTVAFVGREADASAVRAVDQIAQDLGFDMPWEFLSPEAYATLAEPLGLLTPTVLLIRRGQPVMIASGLDLAGMLHVLEPIHSPGRADAGAM